MKILCLSALLCSTLGFAACHTARPMGQRVDASLLQYVDEGQRSDVNKARSEADNAHDQLAIAERKLTESKGRLEIAEKELQVTKAQQDKTRTEVAVERGDDAKSSLSDARQGVQTAEAEVRVREAEIRVADHEVRVAREQDELARARIDLAAARAVAGVDRPECRRIDVAGFERMVRAEEADVQVAQVRLEEAMREAEARRKFKESVPDRADRGGD